METASSIPDDSSDSSSSSPKGQENPRKLDSSSSSSLQENRPDIGIEEKYGIFSEVIIKSDKASVSGKRRKLEKGSWKDWRLDFDRIQKQNAALLLQEREKQRRFPKLGIGFNSTTADAYEDEDEDEDSDSDYSSDEKEKGSSSDE